MGKTKSKKKSTKKKSTKKSDSIPAFWDQIRFGQEAKVAERLHKVLHGDLLEPIFDKTIYPEEKDYWRTLHEGQSFRLTPTLAPKLHRVCHEVQEIFEFDEPVEFYVTNNPTINAAAYLRESKDHSHLIVFNSGLIEKFSEDELRFVIGHELGHIIFKHSQLNRLIFQIFPNEGQIPLAIYNLIRLWEKYAEISADRMGYLAAPQLEVCVSTFFKLASGLTFDMADFLLNSYFTEVDEILEEFTTNMATFQGSHPANPIRIKALQLFDKSDLYHQFAKKKKIKGEDKGLHKEMIELVKMLELHPDNPRDHHRLLVIATGGLHMAYLDDDISLEEEERIMHFLAQFTMYPRDFLESVQVQAKTKTEVRELMHDSIDHLMAVDPSERYQIFDFLCQVAMSDRSIIQEEVDALMKLATEKLGMHEIEASRQFVQTLQQEGFRPKV